MVRPTDSSCRKRASTTTACRGSLPRHLAGSALVSVTLSTSFAARAQAGEAASQAPTATEGTEPPRQAAEEADAASQATEENEQLRRELRESEERHQREVGQLDERLRRLEPGGSNAAQPSTPPPGGESTAANASAVSEFADRQFQRSTVSYERAVLVDSSPIRERAEHVLQNFVDINGYFRAGYGRNDEGGPQVGFQAPGAFSKYRLGNEAETYGELAIAKNFYAPSLFSLDPELRPDGTPAGPVAQVLVRISIFNPYQDLLSSTNTDFGLPEAWASIGNVFAAQPDLKFWAGNRYYRRHDIHISDFFFYNLSGAGGGVEDFQLPFGKLALAWIGAASQSGFSDVPDPDPANQAGFSKANWDLRLYDVPLPLGKGEFGFVYARQSSGLDVDGNSAPDADGVAFNVLHTCEKFLSDDGVNKFSLQFGTGAAKTFTSGFETFSQAGGVFIRPDDSDSWRFRATEHFTANIGEHFSLGPALVYQQTDYGDQGGTVRWVSAGVRPIAHFNETISLAFEGGIDWVDDDQADTTGSLYKLTLAPQVSLGGRFMSRPVIRGFVTAARWSDDFIGQVGGNDYVTENDGVTFGAQMEAWW